MPEPFYVDEQVILYQGDCREIVPALNPTADLIVADPPYGETSLPWDRWPDNWPTAISGAAKSMWCFGSMRMFLDRRDEFKFWRLSQDVVWEKHNGSSFVADRFKRVHELALHWYRGAWGEIHHDPQREVGGVLNRGEMRRSANRTPHTGTVGALTVYDDGLRLVRTVIKVTTKQGDALHPTEKPVGILDPLIRYACPPGGTVLDPFAGSGSTAEAARLTGRKAVLIEADERYCDLIVKRLAQQILSDDLAVPAGAVPPERKP